MLEINKYKNYWLLLIFFTVGWYFSLDLMAANKIYYTILTVIGFLSASLILKMLHGPVKREVHLWIIFILFIIGYYIKFYVLCYFKLDIRSDYLDIMNPVEKELLGQTELIINYYEMITIVFSVFALLIAVLSTVGNSSKIISTPDKLGLPRINIQKSTVKRLLAFTIACSLVLIYIQVSLGIGVASAESQSQLPYRLAGIIWAIYNGIIPLLFLIIVWLADTIRSNYLAKLTIGTYLLFGVVSGMLSTSKASLITVIVSLAVLWLVAGTFTKKRLLLLLSLVPFMGLFNGFLSINRSMRGLNPDFGIFEIMGMSGRFLLSIDTTLTGYEEPVQHAVNYLGLIMRINGADSLMNIVNYAPELSLDRVWHLLFVSPDTISTWYAEDVLGANVDFGVAFSPSLLGYFEFVFGNIVLVCVGMIMYTLFWHLLFRTLLRARLLIEPIVLSLLIVSLGKYTSEGTLESMPLSIALIIAFALFGEFIIRLLTKKIILRTSLSHSSVRA